MFAQTSVKPVHHINNQRKMQICSDQFWFGSFLQQQSLYESARCSRMNYSEKDFQVNSVKLVPHILYETKRCWACEGKKKPSKLSILGTYRKLGLPLQFKTYRWVGKYYELLICLQRAKSHRKDFQTLLIPEKCKRIPVTGMASKK